MENGEDNIKHPRGSAGGLLITWTGVGLRGLGVPCSPQDPRFAGSNPGEVDRFFQDVKILRTSPPGGVPSLRFRNR